MLKERLNHNKLNIDHNNKVKRKIIIIKIFAKMDRWLDDFHPQRKIAESNWLKQESQCLLWLWE